VFAIHRARLKVKRFLMICASAPIRRTTIAQQQPVEESSGSGGGGGAVTAVTLSLVRGREEQVVRTTQLVSGYLGDHFFELKTQKYTHVLDYCSNKMKKKGVEKT
jgi:hypothetical protein